MFDRQQSIRRAQAVDLSSTDQAMPANSPTRAVYIGTGGVLNVQLADNPTVTVSYTVLSGSRHPFQVATFIRASTTATGIVAEF
jgi:hypothetical protein